MQPDFCLHPVQNVYLRMRDDLGAESNRCETVPALRSEAQGTGKEGGMTCQNRIPGSRMVSEGDIKRVIMDYLNSIPGCYARTLQLGGVGKRTNNSKGMSDIIGSYKGWALAIEVKTDKGKVSAEQEAFLAGWTIRGKGIGIVARSLDDVVMILKNVEARSVSASEKRDGG